MMQYFLMSLTLGFVHLSEQEVHEHRVAGIALEQKAHFHSMGKEATEIVKDVIAGTTAGLAAKGMHDAVLPEGQEPKGSYLVSGGIGAAGGAGAYLSEHATRHLLEKKDHGYWVDPTRRAVAGAGAAATDMFVAEHDIASASGASGIFAGTLTQPAVGWAEDKLESLLYGCSMFTKEDDCQDDCLWEGDKCGSKKAKCEKQEKPDDCASAGDYCQWDKENKKCGFKETKKEEKSDVKKAVVNLKEAKDAREKARKPLTEAEAAKKKAEKELNDAKAKETQELKDNRKNTAEAMKDARANLTQELKDNRDTTAAELEEAQKPLKKAQDKKDTTAAELANAEPDQKQALQAVFDKAAKDLEAVTDDIKAKKEAAEEAAKALTAVTDDIKAKKEAAKEAAKALTTVTDDIEAKKEVFDKADKDETTARKSYDKIKAKHDKAVKDAEDELTKAKEAAKKAKEEAATKKADEEAKKKDADKTTSD